jgi:orotidine-5'-phosphate decarboxylase
VSFEEKILAAASTNQTRTVLALDLEDPDPSRLLNKSMNVVQGVKDSICAIKINRQLILTLGLRTVADNILKLANDLSLPTIMDAKLNDVGHTNEFMARTYFDSGFDAIIASPIAGWENGLDKVFAAASARGGGVLLLTYMSNPGAEAFYSLMTKKSNGEERQIFEILAKLALQWKAHGVIVGATKPQIISRVRQLVGPNLSIYSPGVGAQGGEAQKAIAAGATYLIVGRAIYASPDPKSAALAFRTQLNP